MSERYIIGSRDDSYIVNEERLFTGLMDNEGKNYKAFPNYYAQWI